MANNNPYRTVAHDPAAKRRRVPLPDRLALIFTLGCIALLIGSYIAPQIDPRNAWPFALLGLACPLLYLLGVLLALFWVMRWRIVALLPALVLLMGIGNVPLFFHPSLRKHYDHSTRKPALVMMSYNVAGFAHGTRGLAGLVEAEAPDVVCLQEFQVDGRLPRAQIDTLLRALPHRAIEFDTHIGRGLAIYSRLPIVARRTIGFESSGSSALEVDLLMGRGDTLRVISCHLQTTSLSRFMARNGFLPNNPAALKGIVKNLRDNYRLRAVQADTLAALVAHSPHRVVVCGDFNDTPVSYAYRTIKKAPPKGRLKDAFVEQGRGAASTYRGFFGLFRIDYVLHSRSLRTVSYDSPSVPFSDHNPVVVGLEPKSER